MVAPVSSKLQKVTYHYLEWLNVHVDWLTAVRLLYQRLLRSAHSGYPWPQGYLWPAAMRAIGARSKVRKP